MGSCPLCRRRDWRQLEGDIWRLDRWLVHAAHQLDLLLDQVIRDILRLNMTTGRRYLANRQMAGPCCASVGSATWSGNQRHLAAEYDRWREISGN
jgi:hypothetical protein